MRTVALLALALVSGCANVDYATTKAGTFDGEVAVVWLKGTTGAGDGTFVYVPTPDNPMTFARPDGKTVGKVISPPMMYTDGGSVPAIARGFRGFTPWNYGPAYIVHDWVFMARQCLNTGKTDEKYTALSQLTFQDSAEIIAESIQALEQTGRVKSGDISAPAVTFAVTSPFSKALWNKSRCNEVSPEDALLALKAIGRKPEVGDRFGIRVVTDANGRSVKEVAAEVVAVAKF